MYGKTETEFLPQKKLQKGVNYCTPFMKGYPKGKGVNFYASLWREALERMLALPTPS